MPTEMNNQAAQTMPELPAPTDLYSTTTGRGWGYTKEQMIAMYQQGVRDECERIEEHGAPWVPELLEWLEKHNCCPAPPFTDYELIEALEARFGEAALSQTAGVLLERAVADLAATVADEWLEMFAVIPGLEKYERYTYGPAVTLLRDQLREMLAAAPAASGWEDGLIGFSGTERADRRTVVDLPIVNPDYGPSPHSPAGASVSERAREILAQQYEKESDWMPPNTLMADKLRNGELPFGVSPRHLAAIEQALTQQRGSGAYHQGWRDCAMNNGFTTPQPGAEALREYITLLKEAHAHAATYSLTEYEKGWSRRGKVIADELESLLGRGG